MKVFYPIILVVLTLGFLSKSYTQNNALVINNNAYVVLNGGSVGTPIYVVVDQPNQAGITTLGSGGNIISEGEYNYIKWNISSNSGTYVVPFTTGVGASESKIPLQMQITSSGTAGGDVLFSTYETNDMNVPWSSQVTHMNDAATGGTDNSLFVVDRFWQIDASSYGTRPSTTLNFGYNTDASETGGTNTLTVGNLGAQRFNNSTSKWEGWFGTPNGIWGTDNGSGNVSGVVVPASSLYRTWTLSDYTSPLPVELSSFVSKCSNGKVVLQWETSSELNNDYFIIERSEDGYDFYQVGVVDGAGNSTTTINYSWTDENSSVGSYYRLTQVDFDGSTTQSDVLFEGGCGELNHSVYSSDQGIVVNIESVKEENVQFYLFDLRGRLIGNTHTLNLNKGANQFIISDDYASGIYSAVIIQGDNTTTTKLLVK